jgi:hypothetical protein
MDNEKKVVSAIVVAAVFSVGLGFVRDLQSLQNFGIIKFLAIVVVSILALIFMVKAGFWFLRRK